MKAKTVLRVAAAVFLISLISIRQVSAESAAIPSTFKKIGYINFSDRLPGTCYTVPMMFEDWNPRLNNGDAVINFNGIIHNRAFVVNNPSLGGNALQVLLPKEKISPSDTGIQIFGDIGGRDEIFFGVSIYLPKDFECGRELKIPPDIYGGRKMATGGGAPDGVGIGPSVRAVLQECQAKSYVYHLNQKGDNGDGTDYYRNPAYGDKFAWKRSDGSPVIMSKGEKHEITFYARMNTPGKKNGIHMVRYDGELVLVLTNLEFRKDPRLKFDTVGVEIFRGGDNLSYATANDNTLDVTDFVVYVKNP